MLLHRRPVHHRRLRAAGQDPAPADRAAGEREHRLLGRHPHRRRRQHPAHLGHLRRQRLRLAVLADRGAGRRRRGAARPGHVGRVGRQGAGRAAARHPAAHPALAILASLAVGMAMFGGSVFLGQYFQIGRGFSPTEAGLLTIPMMAGVLLSSTISGRMVSNTGRTKPYILIGLVVLLAGFGGLATIDHETSLVLISVYMLAVGIGVGMSMQNLVLVIQNTVPLSEIGAASGAVTFFRSLGGTVGVSVLGAVLANRVATGISEGLAKAGIPAGGDAAAAGGSLNIAALPDPIKEIVRSAYGDATGHIFLISTAIAAVGLVAAAFLKPARLRDSLDLPASPAKEEAVTRA
ncbi:MFS transporter [Nonomuraea thailandensis]